MTSAAGTFGDDEMAAREAGSAMMPGGTSPGWGIGTIGDRG